MQGCKELGAESDESPWEEARRAWKTGKSLGLSTIDEIDVIWAMADDRKSAKGKKSVDSRRRKRGRKGCKDKKTR